MPVPIALAAAGTAPRVEHLEAGVDAGALAIDAYLFWSRAPRSHGRSRACAGAP